MMTKNTNQAFLQTLSWQPVDFTKALVGLGELGHLGVGVLQLGLQLVDLVLPLLRLFPPTNIFFSFCPMFESIISLFVPTYVSLKIGNTDR
jgi:hypothetical protein